jgi:hypothetical protein
LLNIPLVEKLLGILTLILWGVFAYFTISAALDELPSWQVWPAIVGICLPLLIPLLLLSSEGFWARHVVLTNVLGWIWGLLAILGGVVVFLMLVFVLSFGPVGYSMGEVVGYTIMWILATILLWADAIILFIRVTRRR